MKKGLIECRTIEKTVNKSVYCPDKECTTCPDLPMSLKSNSSARPQSGSTLLANPTEFADDYLSGSLPDLGPYFDVDPKGTSFYKDRFLLGSISHLNLSPNMENRLYRALYEFNEVIRDTQKSKVRKTIKALINKKQQTIEHLKRASEYPHLSSACYEIITAEIKLLESSNEEIDYDPTFELLPDIVSQSVLNTIDSDISQEELEQRMNDSLAGVYNLSFSSKDGRPSKLFFKSLQKVVYKLMIEAGLRIGAAEEMAATIINEYFNEKNRVICEPDLSYCQLTSKDINNARKGSG